MEHILFLNAEYPLEPLCRALRAGGGVSTVTESIPEWLHLARIRPWSLVVVACSSVSLVQQLSQITLPVGVSLLTQEDTQLPMEVLGAFSVVWQGTVSAMNLLHMAQRSRYAVADAPEVASGELLVSSSEHAAWWHGEEVRLTPRQLRILRLLVSQPGRVFSRTEIWEYCWGMLDYPESNAIDAHIRRIRQAVPADLGRAIRTVYGVGYRFFPYTTHAQLVHEEPVLMHYAPQSLAEF